MAFDTTIANAFLSNASLTISNFITNHYTPICVIIGIVVSISLAYLGLALFKKACGFVD